MHISPLIADPIADAFELAQILIRSGLDIKIYTPEEAALMPPAQHYILLDRENVPVSINWRKRAPASLLERTITCGRHIKTRDIIKLDEIGIRYSCNILPKIDGLLRLVGFISADTITSSRLRLEEAAGVARAMFQATTSAMALFPSASHFDKQFYTSLVNDLSGRIANSPLALLLDAISTRLETTIQHCSLVTTISVAFGAELGFRADDMERLFLCAFFHDIGKSVMPRSVMEKPDRLTADEMRLMRSHTTVGYEMLRRFPETAGEVADVAWMHHEYLDGTGYPNGLSGGEISDMVRLVTICDIFTALIERRAYKVPTSGAKAYAVLQSMRTQLDQSLVAAFGKVAEQIP